MDKRRKTYFIKQKLLGVAMILFAALTVVLLEGDITIAVLLAPIGFLMVITKETVLMNSDYYEMIKEGEDEEPK